MTDHYRAEADSLGLRVRNVTHGNVVFNLTPGQKTDSLTEFLDLNEANLAEAGWEPKRGAPWRLLTLGSHAIDVVRICDDGKTCGCPPDEHENRGPKFLRDYRVHEHDTGEYIDWKSGRFIQYLEDVECEFCQRMSRIFAQTWLQGVRPTPASEPDTFVVEECIGCFLSSTEIYQIEMDK